MSTNDTPVHKIFCQARSKQLYPESDSANGSRGLYVFSHGTTSEQAVGTVTNDKQNWIRNTGLIISDVTYVFCNMHGISESTSHQNLHKDDYPLYFEYMLKTLCFRNNSNLGCYIKPYIVRYGLNDTENTDTQVVNHIKGIMNREDVKYDEGYYSLGMENYTEFQNSFRYKKMKPFILLPGQTIMMKYFNNTFTNKSYTSDYLFNEVSALTSSKTGQYIVFDILGLPVHKKGNTIGTPTDVGYGYWSIDVIEEDVIKVRNPVLKTVASSVHDILIEPITNAIAVADQEFLPAVNPNVVNFDA